MPLLVTSASGANGNGYGALLAFAGDGKPLGSFGADARIIDPRGLAVDPTEGLLFLNSGADRVLALDRNGKIIRDTGTIDGLNPGGGSFGPDGRYYVGLRSTRTVMALSSDLEAPGQPIVAPGIVPFPRGFAFGQDGRLFLASGIGPGGQGDNTIVAFARGERDAPSRLVNDPELSPLDLIVAPNGNVVVSSEHPFGAADAVTTVREYDAHDGHLVRIFSPRPSADFRRPRGLRFGRNGHLYCVAQDALVAFDFVTGAFLGTPVRFPRLHGQALAFFPIRETRCVGPRSQKE
jgi:DNA-binding beta-propeller fold protein YncE